MVGMYYGLNIDYASLLWEELRTYISCSKIANGVSRVRFRVLILKEVYSQDTILIPTDVDNVEFPSMTIPKVVVDDVMIFSVVA